jgi:hypothetical protein
MINTYNDEIYYSNIFSFIQQSIINSKISLQAFILESKKYIELKKYPKIYKTLIKFINQKLFNIDIINYDFEDIQLNYWILIVSKSRDMKYNYGIVINRIINDNLFNQPITLIIQCLETNQIIEITENNYEILSYISDTEIQNIINYQTELYNKIEKTKINIIKRDMYKITDLIIKNKTKRQITWNY